MITEIKIPYLAAIAQEDCDGATLDVKKKAHSMISITTEHTT
jgi:hypothetical protein